MIRLLLICCALGGAASAQTLPERYKVYDVASNDVLNIRSGPVSTANIIGAFNPTDMNVEVLGIEGNWAYVSAGERMGWVSMRYLRENPVVPGDVPHTISCLGTEPFWDMTTQDDITSYGSLGFERRPLTVLRAAAANNGFLVNATDMSSRIYTLSINALACGDGMSDRKFGMSATLFTESPDGNAVLTGCCTFQVN